MQRRQGRVIAGAEQGRAAICLDSIAIIGDVRNPKKSKIGGKVGYALYPRGTRESVETGGFGPAIPKRAANQEAAFLFMQWLTSKAQDVAIAKAGGSPMRNSTLTSPDMLKLYAEYAVVKEQLKHADPD